METQYDDDTFYAEIRRQILLLTSEDNEDSLERKRYKSTSVGNNGYGGSIRSVYSRTSPPASNFCSWETNSSDSPPYWLVSLWKNGKGTGVFIPQAASSAPNNNRQGTDSLADSVFQTLTSFSPLLRSTNLNLLLKITICQNYGSQKKLVLVFVTVHNKLCNGFIVICLINLKRKIFTS